MRPSKRCGMAVTALLRRRWVEIAWFAFAAANLVAMALLPSWETIPFHFIWISLTLVYGFRVWEPGSTGIVLGLVILATGSLILSDAFSGEQLWGELFEVPLMSAMFLAMVWHARRRQDAVRTLEGEVKERAGLLAHQKRFLHDVSHELRTPVTIARGHLEVLQRLNGKPAPEVDVALDELERIEHILERLLLLAKSKQPDFVVLGDVEVEPFLEDVFMRWSVVPRGWRLGKLVARHPPRRRGSAARRAGRAARERRQVHAALRLDHAERPLARRGARDRGRRRRPRAAVGRARPALRPIRTRRLRALPRPGRGRPRAGDRRRDRAGTRRKLRSGQLEGRRGLHPALSGLRSARAFGSRAES